MRLKKVTQSLRRAMEGTSLRVLTHLLAEEVFRVGTIRKWAGGPMIKQRDGQWVPFDPKGPKAKAAPATASTPKDSKKEKKKAPGDSYKISAGFVGSDKTTEDLFKKDGKWSPERSKIHEDYAKSVSVGLPTSSSPTVYMTGGGPASGKSQGLLSNPKVGIPAKDKAAHVDPDLSLIHISEPTRPY